MDPDVIRAASPEGLLVFFGTMALIVSGTLIRLFGGRWEDWLDERWGRGSVDDGWLLGRIDDDADAARQRVTRLAMRTRSSSSISVNTRR